MRKQIEVTIKLTGDALAICMAGAKANNWTVQKALEFAMNQWNGNLLDWEGNHFPTVGENRFYTRPREPIP